MFISSLPGTAGHDPTNKVRVLFHGGAEIFENVVLVADPSDGSITLYYVARDEDGSRRLDVRAVFPSGGWLGVVVLEGTTPEPRAVGFLGPHSGA